LRAYFDTCVVSGVAKNELSDGDAEAVIRILESHKRGELQVVTSEVTAQEIAAIPKAAYRPKHEVIYNLLADVPSVPTSQLSVEMRMPEPAYVVHEDPLLSALRALRLDDGDLRHAFQAARNNVDFLVTVDRSTFVSRSEAIFKICHVRVITPTEFVRQHLKA
jgi:predicted nucleic acid-binding protein